eukprot:gene23309-biopygen16337
MRPWGDASLGRGVPGERRPWGEASLGRGVPGERRPWGEAMLHVSGPASGPHPSLQLLLRGPCLSRCQENVGRRVVSASWYANPEKLGPGSMHDARPTSFVCTLGWTIFFLEDAAVPGSAVELGRVPFGWLSWSERHSDS